jgi:molecular chaperone GrpE
MRETESEISQLKGGDQSASARSGIHQAEAELFAETARLKEDNERLQSELRREHEMYIRNLADFDNYRRRCEQACTQAMQAGKRELILPLLEVMDDFERALDDAQSRAVDLRAIHQRFVGLLNAQGVTAFDSLGKHFNPLLHEAIDIIYDQDVEPDIVVDEISRGWQWRGELLRPARVTVAHGAATDFGE